MSDQLIIAHRSMSVFSIDSNSLDVSNQSTTLYLNLNLLSHYLAVFKRCMIRCVHEHACRSFDGNILKQLSSAMNSLQVQMVPV